MTIHNILTHASLTLIVAALAIPLAVSASEPDGLASQFQATAAEAAASFRKEIIVNLAKSIRPSRLDSSLVVATKQLEDFDWREQQTSLVQTNGAE
ncbi:MAG: hypothetical protein ACE1ZA_05950 [Pseudomonadales bacterium]